MPATPGTVEHPSLREAAAAPYWLDRPDRPESRAPLDAHVDTDLCIVGGGYSGLWTAILAKERDPSRDVVLLEGSRVGWAASGRNGGFCAASLTHGRANGAERFPDEVDRLDELGRENLDALEATLTRYDIDCDFERPGAITVATEPHQVEWLHELAAESPGSRFLDQDAMRAEVDSPTYLAGRPRAARHRARRPGPPGVGARGRRPVAGRPHPRADGGLGCLAQRAPASTSAPTSAMSSMPATSRSAPTRSRRPSGGSGCSRCPVYDYALMTEPLSPDAARLDRLGRAAGTRTT